MPNYKVTVGQIEYSIDTDIATEAATQIVEKHYCALKGPCLMPIAILVQDMDFSGDAENDATVFYTPEIFANAGMYSIAEQLKDAFTKEFDV